MAGDTCRRLYKTLARKKEYEPEQVEQTSLRRCLNKWDVTAIGVGSTLGLGIYLIYGHVASTMAGPSVVLSFLIAAVAALFTGLCFAEFGARVPRAGGAYSYTYLAVGELMAFIVGWNNILKGLCSTAVVARLLSLYMASVFHMPMPQWFAIGTSFTFFDVFAFFIIVIIGGLLTLGVRESAVVNNLFLVVSLALVLFIVVSGSFAADVSNWWLLPEVVPDGHGVGGFFPFGVQEMLKGAALCFYGFMGFETICAAGEEVQDPRRVIPITILVVLGITLLCYTGVSIVISMMMPYYLLKNEITITKVFEDLNWDWAWWIVAVGSLFGLCSSVLGSLFPLSRLMYAMWSAGVPPRLSAGRRCPALLTLACTLVTALLAGLVDITPLLQLVFIGALISYTAVASSVILLRYNSNYTPGSPRYFRQLFGLGRSPTLASCRVVNVSLVLFIILALINALVATHTEGWDTRSWLIPSAILNALELVLLLVMTIQPQIKQEIYFKTPLVPLVPCLSIYINIHLTVLCVRDFNNWLLLGIWFIIGIIIYLVSVFYCNRPEKKHLQDNTALSYSNSNGKPPVQIIVEAPTPPDTLTRISTYGREVQIEETIQEEVKETIVRNELPAIKEEIILHQASIENNEEKEAKIIDLLDQVLQAEEDSYGEAISIKELKEDDTVTAENSVQRKSLSELSDAGSDASLGNLGLSKYDVIAQVHREDLPKVSEEEEKTEKEEIIDDDDEFDNHEQVTAFNDSDTNSRTDESGYSDTIDRNAFNESLEESKEEIPIIPVPPPLDENFFRSPNFRKSYTIGSKLRNTELTPKEEEAEEHKPRESIKSIMSNGSQNEDNITFGSDRQIHFMSKLNNIFQNKITNNDDEEPRKRSHSTGNVVENTEFSVSRERTPLFLALKGEILSKEAAQNLRAVNIDKQENIFKEDDSIETTQPEEKEEEISLTKEELKSKLENIFAAGGPQLLKPRLMKSNPPTPDDSYQTDVSSTESIPKLPKMEKNDTLKKQKAKFNEVLHSFRISYNQEDAI